MRKTMVVGMLAVALAVMPLASHGADAGPVFTTPLVGITFGALAGVLATLFTSHPSDHPEYVGIGAGIGFAAGLALGISGILDASAGFYRRDTAGEKLYGFNVTIPLR